MPEPGILVGVTGAVGVFVVGVVGVFAVGCGVGFGGCVGVGVAICLGMTIGVRGARFSVCMLSAISDWDGEIWLSGFEAQALKRAIMSNPSKKYDCLLMRYPSFPRLCHLDAKLLLGLLEKRIERRNLRNTELD